MSVGKISNMQIYEKNLILCSIRQLNIWTKIEPVNPYQKNRILQLNFENILIKLSTSLQCQNIPFAKAFSRVVKAKNQAVFITC